ncbi:unnamed protein product [Orchesella dallaii]|uniref:Uncharacterized protein n=1 Tax=Orchesella dallaii TaxID=48710 RepID=A0ABP1Q5S5_9HEXA
MEKGDTGLKYLLTSNGQISDKSEICDELAKTFLLKTGEDEHDRIKLEEEIADYCKSYDYEDIYQWDKEPVKVFQSEVTDALKAVKTTKTYNPLGIVLAVVIKSCGLPFICLLTCRFTQIIKSNAIPSTFKRASVTPLFKENGF